MKLSHTNDVAEPVSDLPLCDSASVEKDQDHLFIITLKSLEFNLSHDLI